MNDYIYDFKNFHLLEGRSCDMLSQLSLIILDLFLIKIYKQYRFTFLENFGHDELLNNLTKRLQEINLNIQSEHYSKDVHFRGVPGTPGNI